MEPFKQNREKPVVIIFDLGNVLFPFDWDIAISGFAETLRISEDRMREIAKNPDYSILFYEFGTGRMSTERFVKKLNELLGGSLSMESVSRIWCSIFREDRKMTTLLKRLSKKYRTFILSDTDELHWNHLQEIHGLEETVTGTILSFRTGSMKSDPGAFEKMVALYRFDPGRTCFIDDLEKNIRAAENVGIKGILHKSYDKTVEALRSWGVETD